jgi:hypothetical protein
MEFVGQASQATLALAGDCNAFQVHQGLGGRSPEAKQPVVQHRRRLACTITPGRPTATACPTWRLLRDERFARHALRKLKTGMAFAKDPDTL